MIVSILYYSHHILSLQSSFEDLLSFFHHSSLTRLTTGFQWAPMALSHSSPYTPQPGYTRCGVTGTTRGHGGFSNTGTSVSRMCTAHTANSVLWIHRYWMLEYADASCLRLSTKLWPPHRTDCLKVKYHSLTWHKLSSNRIQMSSQGTVSSWREGIFQMKWVDNSI